MSGRVLIGDCRATLPTLDADSVQCVITSPPYWGLRDYGVDGQLGLEATPTEYVAAMVDVFRAVKRVLSHDGTLWLNLGDSYICQRSGGVGASGLGGSQDAHEQTRKARVDTRGYRGERLANGRGGKRDVLRSKTKGWSTDPQNGVPRGPGLPNRTVGHGLKHKDMVGIPWRVALALQADGWWLRSDIVWAKLSPMPESVTDRPTKAHEYVFLLTKSERYFYDAAAIRERATGGAHSRGDGVNPKAAGKNESAAAAAAYTSDAKHRRVDGFNERWRVKQNASFSASVNKTVEHRNARSVWTIASQGYSGAHFATMPPALAQRCMLAGSRAGDMVLDPFMGSGTVGMVAELLGRHWLGCELNPKYEDLINARTAQRGLLAVAS